MAALQLLQVSLSSPMGACILQKFDLDKSPRLVILNAETGELVGNKAGQDSVYNLESWMVYLPATGCTGNCLVLVVVQKKYDKSFVHPSILWHCGPTPLPTMTQSPSQPFAVMYAH